MRYLRSLALGATLATATLFAASPASAALVFLGEFEGTDCSGAGGFENCYATQTGVVQGGGGELASPTVFKLGSDGELTLVDAFPSIDGDEFDIDLLGDILSFTYTQGVDDPDLHYFTIKQGNTYGLWYDVNPITSAQIDTNVLEDGPGFSHVTFFNTGATGVPEPGTWAMLLIGFGAVGASLRRRNSRSQMRLRTA
jgi:hypothetical protein